MAGHALRVNHLVVDSALVQAAIAVGHLHVVMMLLLLLGEMCVMLLIVLAVLLMWPLERERERDGGWWERDRES